MLPSQATAKIGHGDADLAFPGAVPPQNMPPATSRHRLARVNPEPPDLESTR